MAVSSLYPPSKVSESIVLQLPTNVHLANHVTAVNKANSSTQAELSALVPAYESLAATSKIHLIQSFISRIMAKEVFEKYFIGLTLEDAEELERVETKLGSYGRASPLVSPNFGRIN